MMLWEEYRVIHAEGYGYSRFCDLFREFERRLSPVMRQTHAGGDKVFVDYSGKKVAIVDPQDRRDAGCGDLRRRPRRLQVIPTAEATLTQTLPDWIGAHVRMFRFLGGVPRLLVPDNLKSGVNRPSFYDPEINRSYGMMASHYDVGILPARPRKPRDKAKVEAGSTFCAELYPRATSPPDLLLSGRCNAAITDVLDRMNERHVMRRLGVSRRQLFDTVETSGAAAVAGYRLAVCRMAPRARRARLSCRGR